MNKKIYLNLIVLITILSPIPFGSVGRFFQPAFYMILLLISWIGINIKRGEDTENWKLLQPKIASGKEIRFTFLIFLIFTIFQIIPIPLFITKLISPHSAAVAIEFGDKTAQFLPLSLVPAETGLFLLRFITISIFFIIFLKVRVTKNDVIILLRVIVYAVSFQSFFGLIKLLLKSDNFFIFFLNVKDDPTKGFLTGTYGNPNHLAFLMEMAIPILIALIFYKIGFYESGRSIRLKLISVFNQDKFVIIDLVLLLLMSVSLILTGSRTGIITFILSMLIFSMLTYYLKKSRLFRKRLKHIFIAIAIVTVFFGIKNTTDKFMKLRWTESGRFLRWPNTIKQFSDFPLFGSGMGTYRYSFYLYDTDPSGGWSTHAHNEYLETLAEGGIVGTILLFGLLGLIIYSITKMWRTRRHPGIRILGIGILSSLFAASFHSFFDFSLRIPSNLLIFTIILLSGLKLVTYRRDFSNSGSIKKRGSSKTGVGELK